jgi:hypothetical protein
LPPKWRKNKVPNQSQGWRRTSFLGVHLDGSSLTNTLTHFQGLPQLYLNWRYFQNSASTSVFWWFQVYSTFQYALAKGTTKYYSNWVPIKCNIIYVLTSIDQWRFTIPSHTYTLANMPHNL